MFINVEIMVNYHLYLKNVQLHIVYYYFEEGFEVTPSSA